MYNSKYYTCEQIDQRLLEGYYDDAVAAGYTGSKSQYLAGLLQAINYSANPSITADKVAYNSASGLYKNVQEALSKITKQTSKIKGVISSGRDLPLKKEISDIGLWFVNRAPNPGIVLVCYDFEDHCVQVKLSATRNVSVNETINKPSIQYRKYIDNAWTEWTEIEFNILKTHILYADGIAIRDTPLDDYIQHLKIKTTKVFDEESNKTQEEINAEQKESLSKLNDSIGDVTKLKTSNKILVNAINELSQKGGISAVAIELLGTILEKAVFVDDEKDNIAALIEELTKGGGGGVVVKKPTITQNASTYMVTMVSEGNNIYYTTNGDAPTKTSTLYTEPFVPDEDCTIKAVAIDADDNMSVVVSLAVKASDIIVFADENLAKVAIAKTTEDVEVTLPDGTTTTAKGFGWDTDGSGFVQKSEAAQQTNFGFNSNNWITSFNEAKYFTKWKIEQYTLYKVTNLKIINLPPVKNIGANNNSFISCGKLKKIIVNEGTNRLEKIDKCPAITELSLPSTLTYFGGITGSNGALKDTTLVVPENVTNFPSFYNTTSISRIKHLNPNLNTIDMTSFSFAGSSRHVWLAATTPPTLTGTAQNGGIGTVYVPDALVDTYKAAEGWSTITVKGHSEWVY